MPSPTTTPENRLIATVQSYEKRRSKRRERENKMVNDGKMDFQNASPLPLGKSLSTSYRTALEEKPLQTKAITSAIIAALGEIIATSTSGRKRNLRRTISFFIYGGAITGPVFHWWYGWLERKCKNIKKSY